MPQVHTSNQFVNDLQWFKVSSIKPDCTGVIALHLRPLGFRMCGLDTSLVDRGEQVVFFCA